MSYTMGVNTSGDMQKLKDDLYRVNKRNEEEAVFDFEAWENAILNDRAFKEQKRLADEQNIELLCHADLWGADGLNNFTNLQEEVDFLLDFGKRHNVKWDLHTSTNGLPCVIDEWCEYLEKNHIGLQLSHDGCMQFLRTGEVDPMDFANVQILIKKGILNWINCTMNFYNWSPFKQIDYYNEKLKKIFPNVYSDEYMATQEESKIFSNLYIKLNKIYDSDYNLLSKNTRGWFNGEIYESLKNQPYGDLAFTNDRVRAEKYDIPYMAHVLDDNIFEWERIFFKYRDWIVNNKIPGVGLMPYRSYVKEQLNGSRAPDVRPKFYGACKSFQSGLTDRTFVLDTIGKYCQCNLLDSAHKVDNPTAAQPEYCKRCKYRYSTECNRCGSVKFREKCEYMYRWNQLLSTVKRFVTLKDYRY